MIVGLQILAMEKLISCIPEIMYDEHQYSHLIHETLSFHTDMISLHDYPTDEASCIHVLTAEEPFKKWIIIEKKCKRYITQLITHWLKYPLHKFSSVFLVTLSKGIARIYAFAHF